ncbi:LysR family transcriptional regulator [Stenotrophomonas sp. PS02301]|uniref:LysR family transcriptional regulator n=1 Tax=Stenotrophomonas sp. PS02301 TaxID=2991427 RepID=UPI00249AD1E6|nr:LysR family transcriptional regulator [Stenotrophomonas sp. PS02301]
MRQALLSTTPSVLSRAVSRLEARLGRQLLQRTTRRVRLSVPTTDGHYRLPPVLARFAQQRPQVQVELNITNRNVDLVAEGFDLAIRLGQLPDSGLVAGKLDAPRCYWWPRRTTSSAAARRRRWTICSSTCACPS